MEIVIGYPPLYAEIAAKFDLSNRKVIFAWGDTIFNPSGMEIGPELLAHEAIHGYRQLITEALCAEGKGPTPVEQWWGRYLRDESFRYEEELIAHRAEYRVLIAGEKDRNKQARLLSRTATRLGSSLYGWNKPYLQLLRDVKG